MHPKKNGWIVIPVYLVLQHTFYEAIYRELEWKCCHQSHHQQYAVVCTIYIHLEANGSKTEARNMHPPYSIHQLNGRKFMY